jgi:uncharacterized protein YbaP (TraB family)
VFSRFRLGLALAALLLGAGCDRAEPARPALWQVDGPRGERAWLFGTIHALPHRVDWRSAQLEAALDASDRLVVEVAALRDGNAIARDFLALAQSPGLQPVHQRLAGPDRAELGKDLAAAGLPAHALDGYETWAAALALQQALTARAGMDDAKGVDRALLEDYRRPVEEFEGARAQLAIFDRLAEADQRELLIAVLRGGDARAESTRLARAWASGDLDTIAREIDGDFLADPQLREALLTGRNRAWLAQLVTRLDQGARPFVAVGAAHLAGADGLPALLAARGYKVTRLQ